MKKIMILGASVLQLPAIIKAKQMGLQTIAVDMDKNAIGFKDADVCLEISTIDIPNVVAAAKQYSIDGVMTLASDMPMRTVARVANELGLIGINEDTALKATNKAYMAECFKDNNVPLPRFYRTYDYDDYRSFSKQLGQKYIVKPTDNSGSRGVFLVNHPENESIVEFAFNYSKQHSRSGEIIIEEYMEGPEVSVETISIEGEVHIIAVTDKVTTGPPRFVEMGHSQPSQHSRSITEQIMNVAASAVRAVGIENGPSHTEIIVTNEGPKVVELGARLGGDNITTSLVPLSTGVDLVECCINVALGNKPEINKKYCRGSAIRYFTSYEGRLERISNVEQAKMVPGVKTIVFTKNVGEYVTDIQSSTDRIGYVIAEGENVIEAISMAETARGIVEIEIKAVK